MTIYLILLAMRASHVLLFLKALLLCLSMAVGFYFEDLDLQSDDGIANGFYPLEELEGFLTPYIKKGLSHHILRHQKQKLGQGVYGTTYRINWPGYQDGAIGKLNKKEYVARHEAAILAYLDGVAGAPKLLAYDSDTGAMAMEFKGLTTLKDVKKMRLNRKYLLRLFLSLTKSLDELHDRGIVHGDLKPDNVMLSNDANGHPNVHFIDFGISTLSWRRGGLVKRQANLQELLRVNPWYSAEFFQGKILDNRSDFPGLAFIMRQLMPDMKTKCRKLFELQEKTRAYDRSARPFLNEFVEVLEWELQRLT